MKNAIAVLLTLVAGCASTSAPIPSPLSEAPTPDGQRALELFESFFVGTFHSIPTAGREHVPTRVRHARIWPERTREHWIYVEHGAAADELHPYRQRIYRLVEGGGKIVAVTYDLPGDPARFVAAWRRPETFAGVHPGDLRERVGCRLAFQKRMESLFGGGTEGERCPGDSAAVAYERTEYYMTSSSMRAWIRGFDAGGRQIAGAPGPTEYRRIARMAQ